MAEANLALAPSMKKFSIPPFPLPRSPTSVYLAVPPSTRPPPPSSLELYLIPLYHLPFSNLNKLDTRQM